MLSRIFYEFVLFLAVLLYVQAADRSSHQSSRHPSRHNSPQGSHKGNGGSSSSGNSRHSQKGGSGSGHAAERPTTSASSQSRTHRRYPEAERYLTPQDKARWHKNQADRCKFSKVAEAACLSAVGTYFTVAGTANAVDAFRHGHTKKGAEWASAVATVATGFGAAGTAAYHVIDRKQREHEELAQEYESRINGSNV